MNKKYKFDSKSSTTENLKKIKEDSYVMDKKFTFDLKDGTTKTMEFEEFVRWCCLIEAVQVVDNQQDVDTTNDKWIKPLAFQKYIDERYHSMKHDLKVEVVMGNI